jgi:hypothetical protein
MRPKQVQNFRNMPYEAGTLTDEPRFPVLKRRIEGEFHALPCSLKHQANYLQPG